MGVNIYESGRDDKSLGVDRGPCVLVVELSDLEDAVALDTDIRADHRAPASIGETAAANDHV